MAKQSQYSFIVYSFITGAAILSSPNTSATKVKNEEGQSSEQVVLANVYHDEVNLEDYWYSEKYDGIRALWTGKYFQTRQGQRIYAPDWFTAQFPKQALDGELWAGRGQFNHVQKTVLDSVPNDQDWENILFMAFDMPDQPGEYVQRYHALRRCINETFAIHLRLVEHLPLQSEVELDRLLDNIERLSGEGVMLRNKHSAYNTGRSDDLLKVKTYQDDEAVVIGYKPGKGKYDGLTGSLLVKWKEGKTFYIGSGLSNKERKIPPPIGSIITFRYNGLTHNGLPRFVRFSHLREEIKPKLP
ncbi:DNA ligase [Vibrio rumoiensis]|uniref:DNA ligase n=1 Tax=Vibrio rumoiensis TaxID=76258 RepID=A0ABW7IXV7_9VIBR